MKMFLSVIVAVVAIATMACSSSPGNGSSVDPIVERANKCFASEMNSHCDNRLSTNPGMTDRNYCDMSSANPEELHYGVVRTCNGGRYQPGPCPDLDKALVCCVYYDPKGANAGVDVFYGPFTCPSAATQVNL